MEEMENEAHAKSSTRSEILAIERKIESYFENKVNSNIIIDLFQSLLSQNDKVIISATNGLQKIFVEAITNDSVSLQQVGQNDKNSTLEETLKTWHSERFREVVDELLSLMKHGSKNTQEQAFSTLITLLLCLHENSKQNNDKFPEELLNNVVMKLLDDDRTTNNLVLKYEDFKDNLTLNYYTLKSVLSLLKEKRKTGASFVFQENVFTLLQLFCTILDESDGKVDNIKKKFSAVWVEFLKLKLSPILYKKILINLHTKILPNLTNPLLLTDFLTDSYNIGGVISLLALNGLFFLIQKYNLEYPDFYTKLYALLTDFIFFVKYRARFFYLTDLFLSSTHIPAYLVAAFAKRLARLSLIAPPDVLITLIPFIGNLLIRHPSLLVLVDRNSENVNEDPFIADETDPSLCNAIDSSLWEIKSLQNHWHPDVSKKAIFVNKQLPKMDWDLADVLEIRYKDLFENEIERLKDLGEEDEIPLSYHQAKGVFIRKEDEMNSLWTL